MQADYFRHLALQVPDSVESAHMNHPDFRVKGRVFASLGYPDALHGMVKLNAEQQAVFLRMNAAAFHPCAGAWGKKGATAVHLPSVEPGMLSEALHSAAENILRPAKSPASKTARKPAPKKPAD